MCYAAQGVRLRGRFSATPSALAFFRRPKMNRCTSRWAVAAALGLLGAVGLASRAGAQCVDYELTQGTGTIVPGTTDIGNHNDDGTVAVTLPFNVNFYGTNYNTVFACSNGWMSFGSS